MGQNINRHLTKDVHVVNKHMKIFCTAQVVREMQIQTVMRHNIHLLEWPKSGPLTIPNASKDVE